MQQEIKQILHKLIGDPYIPELRITDIVEILIIAVIVYEIMLWIKNTKAWMLLRGLLMLGLFILVAYVFRMHAILYLARESIGILAFAALVVFQPELRRALEKLGEKNLFSSFYLFDRGRENLRFSDRTREALVDACFSMGSVKTGALIVVERAIHLTEYEMTGIELDCKVSEQVILNIFEHNTPLHDGAVIIRGDRITSATCYLPLSDNMQISKSLGTRHERGQRRAHSGGVRGDWFRVHGHGRSACAQCDSGVSEGKAGADPESSFRRKEIYNTERTAEK